GVYDVWGCRLPDGSPAPINGWAPSDPHGATNSCGSPGGGMSAEFAAIGGVAPTQLPRWVFTAPANLRIENFTLFRYARVSSQDPLPYVLYYGTPDREAERCDVVANCASMGAEGLAFAPPTRVSGATLDLPRLGVALVCGAGSCPPSQVPSHFVVFSAR